jgi:hypothetical protein
MCNITEVIFYIRLSSRVSLTSTTRTISSEIRTGFSSAKVLRAYNQKEGKSLEKLDTTQYSHSATRRALKGSRCRAVAPSQFDIFKIHVL